MHIIAIVPGYRYININDGRVVSTHGSCPWMTEDQRKDWRLVANRWVLRTSDNTTLDGGSTYVTALDQAEIINNRRMEGLINHKNYYPDQAIGCDKRIASIRAIKFDRTNKQLPAPQPA